jgi:hypothetical protein
MKIPVIINNCNLLSWPRAMVEQIRRYRSVGEIIIIDNGSTYPALLEWYDTNPCTVIRTANVGHKAPWITGVVKELAKDHEWYVVTDPDLDLTGTPDDTLEYLQEKIVESQLQKLGLLLDLEAVKPGMIYHRYLQWFERGRRFSSPIINDIMTRVTVDTTFAIYPTACKNYFIGGGSTMSPYQARHMPWLYTKETMAADAEFSYYLEHASTSASIKTFLKNDRWVE